MLSTRTRQLEISGQITVAIELQCVVFHCINGLLDVWLAVMVIESIENCVTLLCVRPHLLYDFASFVWVHSTRGAAGGQLIDHAPQVRLLGGVALRCAPAVNSAMSKRTCFHWSKVCAELTKRGIVRAENDVKAVSFG